MIVSALEIALLIMLPLVLFYQRSIWSFKKYLSGIVFIYLIWYLTYALFHELMHLLGAWIFDKTIYETKLIPRFWTGDLGSGYVRYDYKGDSMDFIIVLLPYARDMILLALGYFLIIKTEIKKPFMIGLILVIMILSPLFDIGNNYFAYLLGSMNDFNALGESSSKEMSNLIGISFFMTSALITVHILKRFKNYPEHQRSV
ncbi:MAG: hypothetical protein WCK18_17580 [Prolixibacteraceae bacterium]